MTDQLIPVLQGAFSAISVTLMGWCGVRLLVRLIRLLRGQETADGLAIDQREEPLGKEDAPAALAVPARSRARELLLAAAATLGSRLLMYALAYAMYRLLGLTDQGFGETFESLWTHWDTRQYIDIAQNGYTNVGDARLEIVFFPLYSLLMRLVSPLTGGRMFASGIAVSLLCASVAGALLYDVCRMQWDGRTARLALAYWLLNPLSVFLGCVFTESLFICLTLAVVWLLRRGHVWRAALCGALSALTRSPGIVVAGLFLIRFLGELPRERAKARAVLRCLGQMGLVFCGLAVYLLINYVVTGDPFMYMTYQWENWHQKLGTFWSTVQTTTYYMIVRFGDSNWLFQWAFQLFSMFYVFVLLAAHEKELPFDLAAYAFVYTAVVLAPTWLLSGARYLFAMAPLPMLQARAHRRGSAHAMILTGSGLLFIVWIYGFAIAAQVL